MRNAPLMAAVTIAAASLALGAAARPGHSSFAHAGPPSALPPPHLGTTQRHVTAPPPLRREVRASFRFRREFFSRHGERSRFGGGFGRGRQLAGGYWGYGGDWWGPSYDAASYAPPAGEAADDGASAEPPAPAFERPPPCPELLHWSTKLGHEVRYRLCD